MKAEIYNISYWESETNPNVLMPKYSLILKRCGFGIENVLEKHFKPHGYTALFLLSESHFAIHTFPEQNKTYIELSSCIEKPFKKFLKLNE